MYRQRFGLTGHPFPKNAAGKTLFTEHEATAVSSGTSSCSATSRDSAF